MKSAKIILLTSASAALLAGCAAPEGSNEARGLSDAKDRHQIAADSVAVKAPSLTNLKATGRPSNIVVKEGIYLGDIGFKATNGAQLPSKFETKDGVTLTLPGVVGIGAAAMAIEKVTGIRVEYLDVANTPHLQLDGEEDSSESASSADSTGRGRQTATSSGAQRSNGQSENEAEDKSYGHPAEATFRLNHVGKLSDLLDYVASRIQADWVYQGGVIKFVGPQTVNYTIWSLPNSMSSKASVGGASAGSFGGGQNATVETASTYNYWETFEAGLTSIIPNGGSSFAINRSSGSIVVTAPQNIQDRVKTFIEAENRRLSRQVAVKLDVIAFTQDRSDLKQTSIQAVFKKALGDKTLSVSSAIDSWTTGTAIKIPEYDSFIGALSEAGELSNLWSTAVMATNNTPTPINQMETKAYLAGVKTTKNDDEETTEMTPGTIETGFNAVVTPRIMSNGTVNMQYIINMKELLLIENFTSPDGKNSLQLPNTADKNFMQTVNLADGESLIVGMIDNKRTSTGKVGPLSPANWGLGGKTQYDMSDSKIMVIMTPVVIEQQNRPVNK